MQQVFICRDEKANQRKLHELCMHESMPCCQDCHNRLSYKRLMRLPVLLDRRYKSKGNPRRLWTEREGVDGQDRTSGRPTSAHLGLALDSAAADDELHAA